MIFYSQTFLTTNSQLYIPANAIIRKVDKRIFTRKGVQLELPSLVYSIVPCANQDSVIDNLPHNRWSDTRYITDLRLIRIYIIPHSAHNGNTVIPYATRNSSNCRTTQMETIELKAEKWDTYIEEELTHLEMLDTSTSNTAAAATAPAATGRVINDSNLYRTIV